MAAALRSVATPSGMATEPAAADLPLSGVLLVAAAAYGAVMQGGFHPSHRLVLLALVNGAVVVAIFERPRRFAMLRSAPVAVGAAMAAWILVAGILRGEPGANLVPVLACVTLGAVVCVARGAGVRLADGLIVIGVGVALAGWLGVVLHAEPLAILGDGRWRASSSITYANATCAFLSIILLVTLARAHTTKSRWHALAALILGVGLVATISRAGLAACAVGVAVLAVQLGVRRTLRQWAPIGLGVPAHADAAVVVPVAGLVAGAFLLRWMSAADRRDVSSSLSIAPIIAAGVVLVVLALGLGRVLGVSSSDRDLERRAAVDVAEAHPLSGVGIDAYEISWHDASGQLWSVRFVHNEYLQLAGELGLVGVAIAGAGAIAVARWSRARRGHLWPAAVACIATLAVHSGFDFILHVPLIPLTAAAVVGLSLATETP